MIKPDIEGLLQQALRSLGSGCATQTDVDFVWQDVQSMVIRDMMTKDNLRADGRGLIDSRPASYQVTIHSTPPLSNNIFCPACYMPRFVEIWNLLVRSMCTVRADMQLELQALVFTHAGQDQMFFCVQPLSSLLRADVRADTA